MLLAASLALVAAVPSFQSAPRVLATVPEKLEVKPGSLRFSANGKRVAYVARDAKGQYAVCGSDVGDAFDEIVAPTLSDDGDHVAVRAWKIPRAGKATVTLFVDGKKLATEDWIGPVTFSPLDATPVFWQASGWATEAAGNREPTGCALTYGKKKVVKWARCDTWSAPEVTSDGRWVYSVGKRESDWDVVVYDTKGKDSVLDGYHAVEVRARPGGGEIALTVQTILSAQRRAWEPATCRVARLPAGVTRGREEMTTLGSAYDTCGGPVYSPNGRHLAFRVARGDLLGVAIDNASDVAPSYGFIDEIVFDPGSEKVAYVAVEGNTPPPKDGAQALDGAPTPSQGKWFVVAGGTKSAAFDETHLPRWSPDGAQCAFAAREGQSWRVRVGEHASEPFDDVAEIAWALDGKVVWIGARKGRELVWSPFPLE